MKWFVYYTIVYAFVINSMNSMVRRYVSQWIGIFIAQNFRAI